MQRFTDKVICRIVAETLSHSGVENIIVSPGSRNAPLLLAFQETDCLISSIIDERSAAYYALGVALVSRKPVALVCTSGTALLNYAPAVAEAYYQGIPLIVVSADRPSAWIDQDDSQTIRQFNVFNNFVKESYNIEDGAGADIQWYANRVTNDALIRAMQPQKGPVHINVQISAPLNKLSKQLLPKQRLIETLRPEFNLSTHQIKELAEFASDKKILVVLGFLPPSAKMTRAVCALTKLSNIYVMHESLANIYGDNNGKAIDITIAALSEHTYDKYKPDIVITAGGALVSRRIKEYLRKCHCQHWSIGFKPTTVDCFKSLTKHIEVSPAAFFNKLAGSISKIHATQPNLLSNYQSEWKKLTEMAIDKSQEIVTSAPWSSLKAFSNIFEQFPKSENLILGNGTPVRYAQLFCKVNTPHASFCNRGISGIDGQIATACGAASSYSGKTTLILGDVSLAHDLGSLQLMKKAGKLRIIVINNNGGEIFRFIESTKDLPCTPELIDIKPDFNLKKICEGLGLTYLRAESEKELSCQLTRLWKEEHDSKLLEITVPVSSAEILTKFFNEIKYGNNFKG